MTLVQGVEVRGALQPAGQPVQPGGGLHVQGKTVVKGEVRPLRAGKGACCQAGPPPFNPRDLVMEGEGQLLQAVL